MHELGGGGWFPFQEVWSFFVHSVRVIACGELFIPLPLVLLLPAGLVRGGRLGWGEDFPLEICAACNVDYGSKNIVALSGDTKQTRVSHHIA